MRFSGTPRAASYARQTTERASRGPCAKRLPSARSTRGTCIRRERPRQPPSAAARRVCCKTKHRAPRSVTCASTIGLRQSPTPPLRGHGQSRRWKWEQSGQPAAKPPSAAAASIQSTFTGRFALWCIALAFVSCTTNHALPAAARLPAPVSASTTFHDSLLLCPAAPFRPLSSSQYAIVEPGHANHAVFESGDAELAVSASTSSIFECQTVIQVGLAADGAITAAAVIATAAALAYSL